MISTLEDHYSLLLSNTLRLTAPHRDSLDQRRDQTLVGLHKTTRYARVKVIPLTSDCQKILMSRIGVLPMRWAPGRGG